MGGRAASLKAIVFGRVQGVFFRDFTKRRADDLGVTGYVRNRPDGAVEVTAEGQRSSLEMLLVHLRTGPPGANVESIDASWADFTGEHAGFSVRY